MPDIDLQRVSLEDKPVLQRLIELYEHDFSEFDGSDVNEHGLFGYKYLDHYWTEEGREAHFIRVEGKLAGFVLTHPLIPSDEFCTRELAEFFILRKYRRQGVGRAVATRVFDMHPGRWWVQQYETNLASIAFWRGTIGEYTGGNYEEIRVPEWNGPIQVFYTPGSKGADE